VLLQEAGQRRLAMGRRIAKSYLEPLEATGVLVRLVPEDFLKGSDVGIKEMRKRTGEQLDKDKAIKNLLPKMPKLPDLPKTPGATGATTGG